MPYKEGQTTFVDFLCIPVVMRVAKKRLFGRHYLRFGDFLTVCSILYESGAILGRVRSDRLTILAKIFPTNPGQEGSFIRELQNVARKRLKEYKKEFKKEPNSFHVLFYELELKRSGLSLADTDSKILRKALDEKGALEQLELDIKSSVLEGIGFGSYFPQLTEKMYRNYHEIGGTYLLLEMHTACLDIPDEAAIISLEEAERILLQMVAAYISDYYPELLDPLDLRNL
jgi:hypothetical protein